jgi:nitroreductase
MSAQTPSELISLLKRLRAVRQFEDRPLAPEAVRDIHDVIRWSGNAGNQQQFEVLWIENRETLKKLAGMNGYLRHLAGAAAGAVIVTWTGNDEINAFDEGRIAERMMLAALTHGISGSIGWLRDEGREAAKKLLGVPAERTLRTTVSLGYAAPGAVRGARRKPLDELVNRID